MTLQNPIHAITRRIVERSKPLRGAYLERMRAARDKGPRRAHVSCGNQAHVYAAMGQDKDRMAHTSAGNIGIITAYNDMLSAHQPYEAYPELIRRTARAAGGTAQVAGGVPAMCDGVTQGQTGMELSLFSRDVIALAAGIALSHDVFDSTIYLGVCDKIVPGLIIAAATFGHLPAVFLPAGPMPTGLPNDAKSAVRNRFATGDASREELLAAEMASYHGPGTCTFYGTANTNQMLMEFMGLHLPGSSFVNPNTPLREALTIEGTRRALAISGLGNEYTPICDILDERAFVNGIVGLMATGGSTNLLIHLIAMANAAGILLNWQDFSEISDAVPLMARVYPNGLADVNQMHAAGGLGYLMGELLDAGLMHDDTRTIVGEGMARYTTEPKLRDGSLVWEPGTRVTLNDRVLKPTSAPFQATGGMKLLTGNLGTGVMKVSAVPPERRIIEAPARVFHSQQAVKDAFKAGEFTSDVVVIVRFQGPKANGMPELHGLTPTLSVLQDRGLRVALVTDGRMSGASGKVPAAIHVSPEALDDGPIAYVSDGDIVRVDAEAGTLEVLTENALTGARARIDLAANQTGTGRELFEMFRRNVSSPATGASPF